MTSIAEVVRLATDRAGEARIGDLYAADHDWAWVGDRRISQSHYRPADRRRLVGQARHGLPGGRPHTRGSSGSRVQIGDRLQRHSTLAQSRGPPSLVGPKRRPCRHLQEGFRVCQGHEGPGHCGAYGQERPSNGRTQINAAFALARRSVELGTGNGALPCFQMAQDRAGRVTKADQQVPFQYSP